MMCMTCMMWNLYVGGCYETYVHMILMRQQSLQSKCSCMVFDTSRELGIRVPGIA